MALQSLATVLQGVVAWEWDAATDRILASASLTLVYGVHAIENASRAFTLVRPDDRKQHQTQVHAVVARRRGYRSFFRSDRIPTASYGSTNVP